MFFLFVHRSSSSGHDCVIKQMIHYHFSNFCMVENSAQLSKQKTDSLSHSSCSCQTSMWPELREPLFCQVNNLLSSPGKVLVLEHSESIRKWSDAMKLVQFSSLREAIAGSQSTLLQAKWPSYVLHWRDLHQVTKANEEAIGQVCKIHLLSYCIPLFLPRQL